MDLLFENEKERIKDILESCIEDCICNWQTRIDDVIDTLSGKLVGEEQMEEIEKLVLTITERDVRKLKGQIETLSSEHEERYGRALSRNVNHILENDNAVS